MSSWGNFDNVTVKGNVTVATTSDLVSGFGGTEFTSNVNAGDYIFIAANKYQVQNVISNTQIYLTSLAATNSDNVKAYVQQGPKYISNAASDPANVLYSIQNMYGVDRLEIANTSPAANATSHTGWNHYITYESNSGTRVKVETLVAMSKNFNANATSHLQTDAADDSVYPQ